MSYLKLNFSTTFICELYYILLKTSHELGMEGCCYHVTEGVSYSPKPLSLSLLLSIVLYQNCADLHKVSVQFK